MITNAVVIKTILAMMETELIALARPKSLPICSTDGTPSKAVFAVSRDRKNALSSWRISLSHLTTEEELNGFLAAFDRCLKDLQKEK